MQNYKMVIGYDGRRYKGFRKTKEEDDKTIQGKLELILEKLYNEKVEIISAVNTDAGVHAKMQVLHFKAPDQRVDEEGLYDYFQEFLPEDIVVRSIVPVDDRFHSRYNVKGLTYEYRLWKKNARIKPLFERQYVNVMEKKLNVEVMKEAALLLVGEHDFSAFSTKSKVNNSVKNLLSLELEETENEVIVTMTANNYLLSMERVIVGTLVQIGFGERKVESIEKAFKSGKKEDVGHKVMSHALCLTEVLY